MLTVLKFGGTSLGSAERICLAASRAAAQARQGNRVVVVVSAQGDTTDDLLQQAKTVNGAASARELDTLLTAGEQMSAALMAMALNAQGISAVSLAGWQAGIHTDGVHGNAAVRHVDPTRLRKELDAGNVAVVAGFQGVDDEGNLTTLGRGGSDTTAVALAAALRADICRIYTDVDGVYDRDPRQDPEARRLPRVDYDTMLTMAQRGAQVLHDRCVEMAKEHHIPLEVRSTFTDAPGTIVSD